MNNENRKNEYYNYILKLLALIKYSKICKDNSKIDEIEKLVMEMLNNFENCNFNKINYFSKEEVLTPAIGFIFIIKNETNEILFLKNNEKYELPFSNFEIYKGFNENIDNYLKKVSIDIKNYCIKGIINKMPLDNLNKNFSTPEYLFILSSEIKSYNINNSFIFIDEKEINDTFLFNKEEIIKFITISNSEEFYKE